MELPAHLRLSIEARASGLPQAKLARSSENISEVYRSESGQGKRLITEEIEVVTYAIVRMPATYGAVSTALQNAIAPVAGNIRTVLDVGAGTGAATWAVTELLDEVTELTCVEREPAMLRLGRSLMEAEPFASKVNWINEDIRTFCPHKTYDLVIASYSLNELSETDRRSALEKLWACTGQLLVIVEPGTPIAFSQIRAARDVLIGQGGFVAAPCPHADRCPLDSGDWCHFSCRVARSRLHKQLKNADVPYEDEKYSYIAMSRTAVPTGGMRVLRHPKIESGRIMLDLCTESGIVRRVVTKREKDLFKVARKAKWGDLISG